MSTETSERPEVDLFADRPCPLWCQQRGDHAADELRETGPMRNHEGPRFGAHVTVYAEEYANRGGVIETPVVTYLGEEMVDFTPAEAAEFAVNLSKAAAYINRVHPRPWWSTAPNPACRPWCDRVHDEGEFSSGGLFFCEASLDCDSPAVESVTVSAVVAADETPGAEPGALRWDAPDVEVYTINDGRDGEVSTPEALEALMRDLPPVLAEARRIAASDEYATDEQRAAVVV